MPISGSRPSVWQLVAAVLLACMAGIAPAFAQGVAVQGKRLGLVIGLSDYGDTKHPTALQDAGLVSQSLRQAGFELTEAANLTQSELRAAFRDFSDKAATAGPDAVIAVYIAGVGVQDDAENILLPVGARLRQRADLALEGIRVSDLLRGIAGIPGAGRIVMIDAAYAHPYAQLVADGGRGLVPAEKRDGMLIAYNTSPDQVVELPRTNYGAYAMALAEAFREPGLNLDALFERVRLRVHDLSQSTQTPWEVNGIATPLVLVAPVPGQPNAASAPQARRPIADLGADEAYSRAIEMDSIRGYEEFLRVNPDHAQARRIRAMVAARREAFYWQRARRANTSRGYWTYLKRYPNGAHSGEAEARLARLSAPVEPPADFEEVIYDDLPPPPPAEIEIYESVVVEDRWDALPPPPGFRIIGLPPPPVEIIELAPPPPPTGSRILPAVVIGAGVIGAAILANRAWKRPATVRPPVAPPIMRPPRQPVGGGGFRPGQPPVVSGPRPVGVQPVVPGGAIVPPGAVVPGVGAPRPQPGQIGPGVRPQPPGVFPQARPLPGQIGPGGRPMPGVNGPKPPTVGAPVPPTVGAPVPPSVTGPKPPVGSTVPPAQVRPVVPQPRQIVPGRGPQIGPAGAGGRPVIGPATRTRPVIGPPGGGAMQPAGRAPIARPQPTVRAPVPRPQPVIRTPAPRPQPVMRAPAPRPQPAMRAPAPRPQPVIRAPAPRPVIRAPAPRPAVRAPAPRPAPPPSCTPQLRALHRC
jgi:uncharacterized caspase-like protein